MTKREGDLIANQFGSIAARLKELQAESERATSGIPDKQSEPRSVELWFKSYGTIPVDPAILVRIRVRNGRIYGPDIAGDFSWDVSGSGGYGYDIVEYQVVSP